MGISMPSGSALVLVLILNLILIWVLEEMLDTYFISSFTERILIEKEKEITGALRTLRQIEKNMKTLDDFKTLKIDHIELDDLEHCLYIRDHDQLLTGTVYHLHWPLSDHSEFILHGIFAQGPLLSPCLKKITWGRVGGISIEHRLPKDDNLLN